MPIQTLPWEVINLIAAGEVIDSLTAVVRELVENALDAGATNLVITCFPEQGKVQIADNGVGMNQEDLKLCGLAHSTSKIKELDDLWRIQSLGFRGEALHSIAQVAELEIASRCPDELGWKALYNQQGLVTNLEPVAIAPGSIITVSQLFARYPVRRRALAPWSQQSKEIQTLIQDMALCHPQVTWQIWQEEQLWFSISPGSAGAHILPQVLKKVHSSDLGVWSEEVAEGKIELAIGLPDRCHRRRPDWVKIAVNGRRVQISALEQTIFNAFARTLPRERFPVCFLHLHTSPAQVDWNRHPTKSEIYLYALPFWQEKVAEAIIHALRFQSDTLPEPAHNQRLTQLLKAAEDTSNYHLLPRPAGGDFSLIELKALAQVRQTYIVAEHPTGLWLVEQHIAHERVLYEQLQDHWAIAPLAHPLLLKALQPQQVEQLENIGLEIEPFGEQLWAIRSAPAFLATRDDCEAALLELSWGGNLQTAQVATACRSALRNGTPLSLEAMQNLLDAWKLTRNPRTCPHGRPIYLSLEETSLARFFRRHWVIGKSHGI
jgi:DNA mismatch repair protein MutL